MRLKKITPLLFLLFNLFFTPTKAATYFVDNILGNDSNDGLSTGNAWQNLSKVNSFVFAPNDSILFVRNGVWRGQLLPQSGTALGYITYSDYGIGAKPLFLGSINKSLLSDWINEGGNIWRCATSFSTDVGNLIFNGATLFGKKKWDLPSLLMQGDYYYNLGSGELKIYSLSNPALFYTEIECALRNHIINQQNVNYAAFTNLSLKYGAAHGFGGGNTSNLLIRACDVSYIGGGDLNMDGSNIRFGNGIEFWANAHDNVVEQCKIWEIYDTGLSNQNQGSVVNQYNIFYRNNIVYNCGLASYEYWNKPASSTTANIRFENNTCINAGEGWGVQRPDRLGIHVLLSYNEAITDSIFIRNNIFHTSNISLALPSSWNTTNGYQKLILSNNCYYQQSPTDTLVYLFFSTVYNTSAFNMYQTATGLDTNSFVNDPLFINYLANNFHLTATSPAIDQGFPTGVISDFDNENRLATIDIGADEYYPTTSFITHPTSKMKFSIYPNPAQTILRVELANKQELAQVQIYTNIGSLYKEYSINGYSEIAIGDLPAGIYFVRLNHHLDFAYKLIKQ